MEDDDICVFVDDTKETKLCAKIGSQEHFRVVKIQDNEVSVFWKINHKGFPKVSQGEYTIGEGEDLYEREIIRLQKEEGFKNVYPIHKRHPLRFLLGSR